MMKKYFKEINDEIIFFDGVLISGDMQIVNPSEEQLLENGWQIWKEKEIESEEPTEPTEEEMLQTAKNEKILEIERYDKSNEVNCFVIQNQGMWLDATLRQQLRTSVMAYQSLGRENVTKWFNGNEYTFTVTEWLQMLDLLEVYAAEALNVTEMHKAQVNALETIEEVEGYDIRSGYPERLVF